MCKAKYDTNSLRPNTPFRYDSFLSFFLSLPLDNNIERFKRTASRKSPTSPYSLHCLPRASQSSSLDLRSSASWYLDDPLVSADIETKKKKLRWSFATSLSSVSRSSAVALLSRLLPVLLRNFLVGRASTRRLFRDENNRMRVERWPSLVIHVSLLLPRLSRHHNDVSHFLLESSYLNNR